MIRRHLLPVAALALAAAGSLAVAAPAAAGHADVSVGATFPVGDGVVSLVIGRPGYRSHPDHRYDRYRRSPVYGSDWDSRPFYYRVNGSLGRHGHRHSPRCYTRGHYTYHHPACPTLHAYFDTHRVHPGGYWPYRSWTPDWSGYGYRRHEVRPTHRYRGDCAYGRRHRGDCDERCDRRRYVRRDYEERYERYDRDGYDRDRYDRDRRDRDWRDRD